MKKYMFSVISLLFVIVLFLLPINIFKNDIKINYELEEEKTAMHIYYVTNNEIVGLPIYDISTNKYMQIKEVYMYLTEKANTVSEKYETCLNYNTKLISYEILNSDIYLEVDENFFKINIEDTNKVLGQILYTYKELGFSNVYLKYNGEILNQVNSIPTYNGINNLVLNVIYKTYKVESKVVQVIYSYKDNSKSFTNYVINSDIDDTSYILEDLIQFINEEYGYNVSLLSYKKVNNYVNINLKLKEEEKELTKKIISQNIQNIIYSYTYQ